MAVSKGNLGAFNKVTPVITDYGKVSSDIAGRFVAQRVRKRKEHAAKLLAKQKQNTLDQARTDKTYKEMGELSKTAQDFLTSTPMVGAKGLAAKMAANGKAMYSDLMREFPNASKVRQAEIKDIINVKATMGKDLKAATIALNSIVSETTAGMGTIYDEVFSTDTVLNLTKGIMSGYVNGAKTNKDGSISLGNQITFNDLPSGQTSVTYTDPNGKVITKGTLTDIAGKMAQGRVNFVDSEKILFKDFGKNQVANIKSGPASESYGALIEMSRGTDKDSTMQRLRNSFDAEFGGKNEDGSYTNKAVEKQVRLGGPRSKNKKGEKNTDTAYEKIREKAAKAAYGRFKTEATTTLKNNPNFAKMQKTEGEATATNYATNVLEGKATTVGNFLADSSWNDPEAGLTSPKVSDYKIKGNLRIVEVTGSKGDKKLLTYNISDPARKQQFINLLNSTKAKDAGTKDIDAEVVGKNVEKRTITPDETSEAVMSDEAVADQVRKKLQTVKDSDDSSYENVMGAAELGIAVLKDKGYTVETEKHTHWFKDNKFIVKDKDGKVVVDGGAYWGSNLPETISKAMDSILKPETKESPVETKEIPVETKEEPIKTEELNTVTINGNKMDIEDAVTQYKNDKRFKGVSESVIRAGLLRQESKLRAKKK